MGLSVRFPRQRVWPILPGVRSFLNCRGVLEIFLMKGKGSGTFAGMSRARSGMWRSPITRTSRDVILTVGEWSGFAEDYGIHE